MRKNSKNKNKIKGGTRMYTGPINGKIPVGPFYNNRIPAETAQFGALRDSTWNTCLTEDSNICTNTLYYNYGGKKNKKQKAGTRMYTGPINGKIPVGPFYNNRIPAETAQFGALRDSTWNTCLTEDSNICTNTLYYNYGGKNGGYKKSKKKKFF